MSKKFSLVLGIALLLGALIAVWSITPKTLPTRYSQSGYTIMHRHHIQRLAMHYLLAGMAAGFGLGLVVYSVVPGRKIVKQPGTPIIN